MIGKIKNVFLADISSSFLDFFQSKKNGLRKKTEIFVKKRFSVFDL